MCEPAVLKGHHSKSVMSCINLAGLTSLCVMVVQAQAEQHAQQAEMHVHLLQEANASLASERSSLLQRAVTAERALGTEREALVHRALTAEQATCALMEQHARDTAASSGSQSAPACPLLLYQITAQQGTGMYTGRFSADHVL